MKKMFKKIKRISGLELPHLLEEEEEKEPIIFNNKKDNIIAVPKNVEVKFYKDTELEKSFKMLANAAINSCITMNEAREIAYRLGEIDDKRR